MSGKVDYIDLLIEVKCSRSGRFRITARDLEGLGAARGAYGFLAALITADLRVGPRWAFVSAEKVHARTYDAATLAALAEDVDERADARKLAELDYMWGEVVLDSGLVDKLVSMNIDGQSRDWWQGLPFSPQGQARDAIRKIKVGEGLERMRALIDERFGRHAAKREGFLHQCILCFCLHRMGCRTVFNNSGVPDLHVRIEKEGPFLLNSTAKDTSSLES